MRIGSRGCKQCTAFRKYAAGDVVVCGDRQYLLARERFDLGKPGGRIMFDVQCPKCGNENWQPVLATVKTGESKFCCTPSSSAYEDPHESSRQWLYHKYSISAKKRHIYFDISFTSFWNIISQPCLYCGEPPKPTRPPRQRGNWAQPVQAGTVDRLDSSLGYIEGNCVPCCSVCNTIKMAAPVETFLATAIKIAERADLIKQHVAVLINQNKLDANRFGVL